MPNESVYSYGNLPEKMKFNSGDFVCDMVMGKIVDDDQDGIEFRNIVSLNDMYSSCHIIQSIHNPFITLTVQITESKQVLEKFGTRGLQGEEFIKLLFRTPERELIEDVFYVTGYEPISTDDQEQVNAIVLKAVAKERLINSLLTVNKSFKGSYHKIADNIFRNALLNSELYKKMLEANKDGATIWKKPDFFADETDSVDKFIIPGVTPFRAISRIAARSFGGSGYPGSLFNFYQTNHGFHFANIEKRIAQEPWDIHSGKAGPLEKFNPAFFKKSTDDDGAIDAPFTYDPEINDLPRYDFRFFKNIKNMSPFDISNTLGKIDSGSLINTVRNIQPLKKSFTETTFNLKEQYNEFKRTGKHFNMSAKFFDTFGSDPVEYTVFSDGSRFDEGGKHEDYLDKVLGKRNAYIDLFTTYKYIINVYGDSNLNVGETIIIDLREAGVQASKPEGSMYKGKYFITDLDHVWDHGTFNTTMCVVKDSPEFLHGNEKINPLLKFKT